MRRTAVQPQPTVDWESLRPVVTDELLAAMTRRIVEAFHPYKVILFGSYAYGTPHRDSDVDLLVIMESDERSIRRSLPVYEAAKVEYLPLDLLVRTPAEIQQRLGMGDHFIREVMEKGRVLYERDSDG